MRLRDSSRLTGSIMALVAAPFAAHAQTVGQPSAVPSVDQTGTAPAADGGLQDIVVTAQRRSENLQRVPIAVTVATGDQLARGGVSGVQNLEIAAPSVKVQSVNGYVLPIIRGIGSRATGAGIENPVAIYVDGVYFSSSAGVPFSFNNIEQVEVLKGPQGTLFGRNATGGLIQIRTKDPSHDTSAYADLTYGNYQTGKLGLYATTGLTANLAADIAFEGSTQGKGYGRNLGTGSEVGKVDHDLGVRSKFFLDLADTKARLSLDYTDVKGSQNVQRIAPGVISPAPFNIPFPGGAYDTNNNVDPRLRTRAGGVSLRLDHNLGKVGLVSITAYRRTHTEFDFDLDFTPIDARYAHADETSWQFSQELQLLSRSQGSLTWLVGAFYFRARGTEQPVTLGLNGVASVPTVPRTVASSFFTHQDTESISGFGQATLAVASNVNLTAGLRYTSEKRTLQGSNINTRADGSTIVAGTVDTGETFSKPSWRLAIDYNVTPQTLAYASYNRGFRSGGFNPLSVTAPAYRPEVLDAYEVGLKNTLFDRRVRLNGAAFYYNYKDVQINRLINGFTGVYNGARAETYGAEIELDAQPSKRLRANASYQYLHGRYTSFPSAVISVPRPVIGDYVQVAGDASGNTLALAPTSVISLSGTYAVPVGDGSVDVSGNFYHNSGYYHEPDNVARQPAYDQVNASLRWRPNERFSVSLWVNNLTDKPVQLINSVTGLGAYGAVPRLTYAPPRTYGVTVGAKF